MTRSFALAEPSKTSRFWGLTISFLELDTSSAHDNPYSYITGRAGSRDSALFQKRRLGSSHLHGRLLSNEP